MIPDNIKQKIADRPCDTLFGYELASIELQALKDENEAYSNQLQKQTLMCASKDAALAEKDKEIAELKESKKIFEITAEEFGKQADKADAAVRELVDELKRIFIKHGCVAAKQLIDKYGS